jgi:hypothetical protein
VVASVERTPGGLGEMSGWKKRVRVAALTPPLSMVSVESLQASAEKIYRCTIQDGVQALDGKFIRGDLAKYSIALSNPIIVDTASGVMRDGKSPPRQWIIKQRATPEGFFIAIKYPEESGLINIKFTLMHQSTPVTFIYEENEGTILLTGTCDVIG